MRAVILTSSLGYGHVKAAQAIDEALREYNPDCTVDHVDFWSLMDSRTAGAIKAGYLDLVTHHPKLYDLLYSFDRSRWRAFFNAPDMPSELTRVCQDTLREWFPEHRGFPASGDNLDQTLLLNLLAALGEDPPPAVNLVRRGLVLWTHRRLVKRLKRQLIQLRPEVIFSSQTIPASLLAALRREGCLQDVPTIATLTDYGVHAFWIDSNIDHYCVATPEMLHPLGSGQHPVSASVTGIPLMKGFRDPPSASAARKTLGIPAHRPTILITGGGYGIGICDALKLVVEANVPCEVLIAASNARHCSADLDQLADDCPFPVHLYRSNLDMPTLLRAADVVIGKPGGLSVSEALACGRPFLAISCLGGQERFNVDYLQRCEVGALMGHDQAIQQLRRWLADPAELAAVQDRAWKLGMRNGAEQIAGLLDSVLADKQRKAIR